MNIKRFLTRGNFFLFLCGFFVSLLITSLVLTLFYPELFVSNKMKTTLPSVPVVTSSLSKFLIKGSIPYWDQEHAVASFEQHVAIFSYVNLFWYYLGSDGSVVKYEYAQEDPKIITFAHNNNVKVSAVITNLPEFSGATWNSNRVLRIVHSQQLKERHIANIVNLLKDFGFDGVIIDYESLGASTRDDYSNFIKDLAIALHKDNKIVTVVLHPKTGENVDGEDISDFQDWKELALYADQLQIMGYSEHSDTDSAGPVASAPWVGKIIDYAKSLRIPLKKFYLGVPFYGYDWDTYTDAAADDVVFSDVERLLSNYGAQRKWSNEYKSPHFTYTKNGHRHEVWYEDSESVIDKVQMAKNAGFAGVTFWRLGEEDPMVWNVLRGILI